MAGFMAGFGSSLSNGIDAAVKAKQEQEADSFRLSFQNYLSRKEKLTKLEEETGKTARRAKEYAAMYGQDIESAKQIYEWLDSGMSEATVTERLEKFKLTPVETVPAVAKIDTQMAASGLDPRASTGQETDPQNRMVQRSIGRIAEITGETPDAIGNVMAGRSKPPEIGDGTVGSFKLVPKDIAPDKLTDADIAARYTKLQTDAVNGVEGAQTKLEVFEKVTLPAYKASKSALENPTGDNVLPDLIFQYGQAPEGSPEKSQLAGRIEAHRRAAELKKGDTSDGYASSVIFNEDGTTDIGMVRTVIGENGERSYVRLEQGKPVRVEGEVQKLDEEQRRALQSVYSERLGEISKHEERMTQTGDALRLSQQVFDLVDADPRVLTATAGAARRVTDATREVFTAVDVLKGLAEKNGAVSEQEIERALGGSIENTEAKITAALGSDISDLGEKKALFDAKVLLAGFRLGGLEGQSGNGLSNQDFDRILNIVDASNDKEVFKKQWSDYVQGRIQQNEMRADLVNNYNGRVDAFEQAYGFRPIDKLVTNLTDYIGQSGDQGLKAAYDQVQSYANKPITASPAAIPRQSATPLAAPTQNSLQRPDKGTERAVGKLPNGMTVYEVTLPDGTTKRVKR